MPPAEFQAPPDRLCVLRLSAIGDVCHALPVVRTIQDAWPTTSITWILGRVEHKLIGHLPDIDFVVFDKRAGIQGYRELRRKLAGRRYDVLLHMQLALRASAASALVPARIRLGYDRARAREGQWLFTNRSIAARSNQHVLDGMFGFAEALGLATRSMRWRRGASRSRTMRPRWWSALAPATNCATGAPSATRHWPTMRSRVIDCG